MLNKIYITILLAICTLCIAVINLFGLMQLIPPYITVPLLFISIYTTLYTFTYRNVYRGRKKGRYFD